MTTFQVSTAQLVYHPCHNQCKVKWYWAKEVGGKIKVGRRRRRRRTRRWRRRDGLSRDAPLFCTVSIVPENFQDQENYGLLWIDRSKLGGIERYHCSLQDKSSNVSVVSQHLVNSIKKFCDCFLSGFVSFHRAKMETWLDLSKYRTGSKLNWY